MKYLFYFLLGITSVNLGRFLSYILISAWENHSFNRWLKDLFGDND